MPVLSQSLERQIESALQFAIVPDQQNLIAMVSREAKLNQTFEVFGDLPADIQALIRHLEERGRIARPPADGDIAQRFKGFSPYVIEQLGWYVYALSDPEVNEVFYIGKGIGGRLFAHEADAAQDMDTEREKLKRINSITKAGREVARFIIQHGIKNEALAYAIESAVIDGITLVRPGTLLNEVVGHHHHTNGLARAEVVASIYEAPDAPEITEPTMLFRIPLLWSPQLSDAAIYEATHGWWRVGPRREGVRYAFAVSRGVIRGAYRVPKGSWRHPAPGARGWNPKRGAKLRWGFDGEPAPEMEQFLNTSVRHLFKPGEQSPTKYVNC